MSNAIVKIPTTEMLRYADILDWKEKNAVTNTVGNNIDQITSDKIGYLLSGEGQQALRKQRNIGNVSLSRIRLWLAFHPNRRTEEAASGKLYDELRKLVTDPDQPAGESK